MDSKHCGNDSQCFPLKEELEFNKEDLAPATVTAAGQIDDGEAGKFHFKTPFDSGSTDNITSWSLSPKNTELFTLENPITVRTADGIYSCAECVHLHKAMFPELSLTQKCKTVQCLVINSKMGHQLVIGRKCVKRIGVKMDFETSAITWCGKEMSFHPRNCFENNQLP